jgi:hypothetical protein
VFIRTVCGVYDSGARFRVEELQPMDCHAAGSRLHERDTTDIVNLTKAGNARESRRKGGGRRRVRPHGGSVQVRQGVWHMGVMHARLAHAPYRVSLHDARRGVPCGATWVTSHSNCRSACDAPSGHTSAFYCHMLI